MASSKLLKDAGAIAKGLAEALPGWRRGEVSEHLVSFKSPDRRRRVQVDVPTRRVRVQTGGITAWRDKIPWHGDDAFKGNGGRKRLIDSAVVLATSR